MIGYGKRTTDQPQEADIQDLKNKNVKRRKKEKEGYLKDEVKYLKELLDQSYVKLSPLFVSQGKPMHICNNRSFVQRQISSCYVLVKNVPAHHILESDLEGPNEDDIQEEFEQVCLVGEII